MRLQTGEFIQKYRQICILFEFTDVADKSVGIVAEPLGGEHDAVHTGLAHALDFFHLCKPGGFHVGGCNDGQIVLVFCGQCCQFDTFFQRQHGHFGRTAHAEQVFDTRRSLIVTVVFISVVVNTQVILIGGEHECIYAVVVFGQFFHNKKLLT